MAYIYNLIDTWNNAGTTFTAIKMNVTDTNSSASSLLMDLQVGAVTQFNVRKDGSVYTPNGIVAMGVSGAGPLYISTNSSAVGYNMASGLGVGWTNSATNAVGAPDTILRRDAAATLAQRNSTNAQTYRLYGTYTDASNYERGYMTTDSNGFTIGTEALGTGTKRPVRIIGPSLASAESVSILELSQTWNTSGTPTGLKLNVTDTASNAASLLMDLQVGAVSQFKVSKAGVTNVRGDILPFADNGINIGSGALRINTVMAATAFRLTSAGAFDWSDTILTRRAAANLRLGAGDAAAPVAQTLSVQSVVAGTSNTAGANWTFTGSQGTGTGAGGSFIFQVAPAGSSGSTQNALADAMTIDSTRSVYIERYLRTRNNIFALLDDGNSILQMGSTVRLGWTAGGSYGPSADTILQRDAANTLALRNSTAAQAFNIYDTYTDASNYRRTSMYWSGGAFNIDADGNAGTGITVTTVNIKSRGNITLQAGPGNYDVVTNGNSGGALYPGGTTNTTNLGRSDKTFAIGYFGTSVVTPQVTIPLQTLTDGANVAWNCNNGAKAKVTLAGNRTIDAVTNAVEGTSYTLWVIQDATGSRTVTWTTSGAGSFDFGTEGTPVLTTTASAADALGFEAISIGGTLKLRFMGIKRGFA